MNPVRVALEPGCTIVFYTDGLVEWSRDTEAGEAALQAAIDNAWIRNAPHPAKAIRDACVKGAHADDIALLVIKYEPSR